MKALIASENGCLYTWKSSKPKVLKTIFKAPDYLMGLAKKNDIIYASSRDCIYALGKTEKVISAKIRSSYHHLDVIDGSLYVTATRLNEIHKFNIKNHKLMARYVISPPNPNDLIRAKEDGPPNYNHINKIFWYEGKFYVNLNWLTNQYEPSGVAVLDENMNEIERFQFSWQSHGFCIVDGTKYALCAATGDSLQHPKIGGLIVDGEVVYQHDPNEWICKGLSINDDVIVLVGGQINLRENRKDCDGMMVILDKNFNEIDQFIFHESGGFKGILLEELDYTKCYE